MGIETNNYSKRGKKEKKLLKLLDIYLINRPQSYQTAVQGNMFALLWPAVLPLLSI